jgi:hypothetical protein
VSLSDQIKTESNKLISKRCKIGLLLSDLSEEDKESLVQAFDKPPHLAGGLSNVQIHRILISEGFEVALSTVDRHRNKYCGCYMATRIGK